jgi:hypothetical protein
MAVMTDPDRQHLSDEQMNELVLADVNDPTAWGDPIVVGPSKGPRRIKREMHLELAAKFYVLSVLHRLGSDANLTFSQSDNADITIGLESGETLTVEVKTLTGPMEWPVSDFRAHAGHFLTFVWFPNATDPSIPPSVYIVGSEQLRVFLAQHGEGIVSLDRLDEEVHARNAWDRLAVSTAA